jgi:DNA-binding XRE family transcriptional regulator
VSKLGSATAGTGTILPQFSVYSICLYSNLEISLHCGYFIPAFIQDPFLEQSMYGNPQRRAAEGVQELRREGGRWLKQCREAAGLSQRELAQLVGAEYYTFISQLETGRGRIPPDHYHVWADALKIPPKEFVRNVLRFYDPVTYGILLDD